MRAGLQRVLWGVVLVAAGGTASANELQPVPSAAVRCLTPDSTQRGQPVYPKEELEDRVGGTVQVELIFTTPDKRPEVNVLESSRNVAFVDAVKDHVRQFRVPCLEPADIPVRLRQTYVFVPDGRLITSSAPVDADEAERRRMMGCVVRDDPSEKPEFPWRARRSEQSGRVLVVARFSAPDQPPQVKTFDSRFNNLLVDYAKEWVRGYRMPCHSGRPVEYTYTLEFSFVDSRPMGFKDISLRTFVGAVKGIEHQRVVFDFRTMQCPFEIQLHYRQPHLPNHVGVVGEAVAARQPFLDWLSQAELRLTPPQHAAVVGAVATLDVPCGGIDLVPRVAAGAASAAPSSPR